MFFILWYDAVILIAFKENMYQGTYFVSLWSMVVKKIFFEGATLFNIVFICMGQLQTTSLFSLQLFIYIIHEYSIHWRINIFVKKVSLLLENHFVWHLYVSLSTSCWQTRQGHIKRAHVSEAYFKPILIIKYLKLMFMSLQKHARKVVF